MDVDSLTRLLVAARDGDDVALAAWVRATQGEVRRLCAALVHPQASEDVAQEVYLRAMKALPRYRAEASARTWLLTIARTTSVDAVRSRARRRRLTDRLASERNADQVADQSGATALQALVAGLDPDRRDAFALTQVTGLSYAEAAEVCRVPIGTIRSRVARAREDLLAALSVAEEAGAG